MFVLSNFLFALAKIINIVITIFYWLILIRALISWVNLDLYNPIVQFLHKITEPILNPLRRILPTQLRIGIDISPIVAFFILIFLKSILIRIIVNLAYRFR